MIINKIRWYHVLFRTKLWRTCIKEFEWNETQHKKLRSQLRQTENDLYKAAQDLSRAKREIRELGDIVEIGFATTSQAQAPRKVAPDVVKSSQITSRDAQTGIPNPQRFPQYQSADAFTPFEHISLHTLAATTFVGTMIDETSVTGSPPAIYTPSVDYSPSQSPSYDSPSSSSSSGDSGGSFD